MRSSGRSAQGSAASSGCGAITKRRREVLRGQVVGDRAGHRGGSGDAGDGAELLLDVGRRRGRAARPRQARARRGSGAARMRRRAGRAAASAWSSGSGPRPQIAADRGENERAVVMRCPGRHAICGFRARSGRRRSGPPGAGRSRPRVQPPASGSAAEAPAPPAQRARAPARPRPRRQPVGRGAASEPGPEAEVAAGKVGGVRWRSNSRSRQCRIIPGSGIFIGQTLSQRPQKVRGVGQVARLVDADQRRRQHRAHRPGIDPAIGVAAHRAIDRAMVHAGGAADAAQHVLELAAEHPRAAVVEQDDVVLAPARRGRPARRGPVEKVV